MSSYSSAMQLAKMLENVLTWLDRAEEHAKNKKFDPETLLQARLAPDMYPLMRQLQSASDGAKFCAARLAGKDPPKHPDTETKLAEIRQRLRSVIEYAKGFKESDFVGSEERLIAFPTVPGKGTTGADYRDQFVVPNFYFHVGMVYAILRHNGVDLGKLSYLGAIPLRDL
jgi:uncharacterized protein